MEKNGLIERKVDPKDTRIKKVILTKKTEDAFLEGKKRMNKLGKMLLKGVSPEEIEIFSNVIRKMKENIENNNKEENG